MLSQPIQIQKELLFMIYRLAAGIFFIHGGCWNILDCFRSGYPQSGRQNHKVVCKKQRMGVFEKNNGIQPF
jgi:hypothetical protein